MTNIYKVEGRSETYCPALGQKVVVGINDTEGYVVVGRTVVTKNPDVIKEYYQNGADQKAK